MAIEIEAKMKVEDVAGVERALATAGATPVGRRREINTFFDTPDGSLRASDQGLRVRVEHHEDEPEPRVIVTHKGPRQPGELKTRPETELHVASAQAAADLLTALGFIPTLSFEKDRRSWTLADCSIELDRVPHLGHFLEIEGPSEAAVLDVRRRLGLDHLPLVQAGYATMLRKLMLERGENPDLIRLEP